MRLDHWTDSDDKKIQMQAVQWRFSPSASFSLVMFFLMTTILCVNFVSQELLIFGINLSEKYCKQQFG